MDYSQIDSLIAKVNEQIGRVKILRRGERLYLRGRFPPKPGDGSDPKRYEISTGYRAINREVKLAEGLAREVEGLLIRERFDWTPYLKGKQKLPVTVHEWIERLETDHWSKTPQTLTKLNTWKKNYREQLDKLPQDTLLTAELLKATILERSQPGTRSRKGYCLAYRKLANFADLEGIDFAGLSKGYKAKSASPDELPSDEEIVQIWENLTNPGWKWVFGMMATYGIRNHEIFRLDMSRLAEEPGLIRVLGDTKTGERLVWPCPASWWSRFQLWEVCYPKIKVEGRSNNDLGEKISQEFKEQKIPFSPYRLRDAYAIRTAVYGVDVSIAAKWMGHSVQIHCEHYQDAINERHHRQVFELMRQTEERMSTNQSSVAQGGS
jgi:integrase